MQELILRKNWKTSWKTRWSHQILSLHSHCSSRHWSQQILSLRSHCSSRHWSQQILSLRSHCSSRHWSQQILSLRSHLQWVEYYRGLPPTHRQSEFFLVSFSPFLNRACKMTNCSFKYMFYLHCAHPAPLQKNKLKKMGKNGHCNV